MTSPLMLCAKLTANPYPGTLKLCQARTLPLEGESDFSVLSSLPVSQVPVFVNHSEHYQLLCELIDCLFEPLSNVTLLIRMQMPAGGRMPKAFLDERILMVQDVCSEEYLLKKNGVPLVVLDDRIIRYPLEKGNNELAIRFYHCNEAAPLIETLSKLLVERGFSNIAAHPLQSFLRTATGSL